MCDRGWVLASTLAASQYVPLSSSLADFSTFFRKKKNVAVFLKMFFFFFSFAIFVPLLQAVVCGDVDLELNRGSYVAEKRIKAQRNLFFSSKANVVCVCMWRG